MTMLQALLLAALVAQATANAAAASTTTSTSQYPVVSLFLPMADPQILVASIVTAAPNATVYAIGCPSQGASMEDANSCGFNPAITVTEGVSTLAYTLLYSPDNNDPSSSSDNSKQSLTNECQLIGGTQATQAICTAQSAISGLGNQSQTTTLASSEIIYVPVTITAGEQKTAATAMSAGASGASATKSGGAPIATAAHHFAVLAGLAVVGIM